MGRVTRTSGLGAARGVAADELRRHNLATVLEHLHLNGSATRSELTNLTGLNRSTVADLIGELRALDLVEEGPGAAPARPGRPSPIVHLRPEGAVVLALEMSVDSIAAATIGIGGHLYDHVRIARDRRHLDPKTTVEDIAQLALPLLAGLPPQHNLIGISAAVVGVVRRSDGFVHLAPNLGWQEIALGPLLRDALGLEVPVSVANEADLGALGEYRRGGMSGVSHLVYVSGEVGIGCGLIADGEPVLGSAGYAGEAGHTMVNPEGLECRCGATGCWETEAGEQALLRRVESIGSAGGLEAVDAVAQLAEAGDPATLAAISETGLWLGIGISNLVNLLNPDVIVLGGLYHRLIDYLYESVVEGAARSVAASRQMVTIRGSAIGTNAPLVGAAELALADLISDPAMMGDRR